MKIHGQKRRIAQTRELLCALFPLAFSGKGEAKRPLMIGECDGVDCCNPVPELTASLDATVSLAERVLPGVFVGSGVDEQGPFAWVRQGNPKDGVFARAATEALSRTRAIIRALIAKESAT